MGRKKEGGKKGVPTLIAPSVLQTVQSAPIGEEGPKGTPKGQGTKAVPSVMKRDTLMNRDTEGVGYESRSFSHEQRHFSLQGMKAVPSVMNRDTIGSRFSDLSG